MFNPLDHPIAFAVPRRTTSVSAWHTHIPFAMLLVELLKPRLVVELGTHAGDSYCALCQAVDTLGLSTRAVAVDTWAGDGHTGSYGPDVLVDLRAHHDELYGGFSSLLQKPFDEAVAEFADATIDILHIDGCHTYEAVKHDFETWLPKVSDRGVVLLHDTNERIETFGVWRLWSEIETEYPTFHFLHGHGLGVAAVGRESARLVELLTSDNAEAVRALFAALGERVRLGTEVGRYAAHGHELEVKADALAARIEAQAAELVLQKARATSLEHQLVARRRAVESFQSELAEIFERAHRAESHLSAVLATKTWRFTARARAAYGRIHGSGPHASETRDSRHTYSPTLQDATARAFNDEGAMLAIAPPRSSDRCAVVPFAYEIAEPVKAPRIAVAAHIFHTDLAPEIMEYLGNIPFAADLYVTTDTIEKREELLKVTDHWNTGTSEVRIVPNRGRDVSARVTGLADLHSKYELILHVHSKKSPQLDRAHEWRTFLYRSLVGSPAVVRSVVAAFEMQPLLGVISPQHWEPVRRQLNWGFDFQGAQDLARRMGFDLSRDEPLEFPSGSMFWTRGAALRPLIDLSLSYEEFADELGQHDGTLAHSIERLIFRICEWAGFSWMKIADPELLEDRSGLVSITTPEELADFLRTPGLLLRDPALRPSIRTAPRGEHTMIRFAPEFDRRARVNLLLPTLKSDSVWGGIATAHALFNRVADALGRVEQRILLTADERMLELSDLPTGFVGASPQQDTSRGPQSVVIQLPPSERQDTALRVRPNDIFFASAWWDAAAVFDLIDLQRSFFRVHNRLRYFIQDFEPGFSPWSSSWVLADQTYRRSSDTVALINSDFLAAYLCANHYHFDDVHVFRPVWNEGLDRVRARSTMRRKTIVVYWRPSVERNLAELVRTALSLWIERDPLSARDWEIVGVGEHGDDVPLAAGCVLHNLGKLQLPAYESLISSSRVGLALMLSPHPSYPPLEMAAFGMTVVTNRYGPKDLSTYGSAFEITDSELPIGIANALGRAVARWDEPSGPQMDFDFEAAFASEDDLKQLAEMIAAGITRDLDDPAGRLRSAARAADVEFSPP